ncbi:MAG: hypothetical protein WCE54_00995, partial [Ignavibacteriaceae bacterium]
DSNPQRRQPTDLQSAPALQLRRPPKIKNRLQIYFDYDKNANLKPYGRGKKKGMIVEDGKCT